MDRIEITGLRAFGHHGLFPEEQQRGQTFVVDLRLECDLRVPGASDDIADTVDYDVLARVVASEVSGTRYTLIETLAERLAELALAHPMVQAVEVRVAKPEVPMGVDVDAVAVVVRRARDAGA